MKNFTYAILTTLIATSCASDEGSYDYHEINEVTIDGMQSKYQVMNNATTLKIEPVITTTMNDETDLEYEWRAVDGYNTSTLLSTERNLNYKVDLEVKNYTLYFRVRNKKTGVTYPKTASLEVGTPYTKGLMIVGTDQQSKAKIQMLSVSADTVLIEDVLGESSELSALSEPTGIYHTGKSIFDNYPRLWLLTKDQAYSLDMKTMKGDPSKTFSKNLFLSGTYDSDFIPVDFAPHIKDQSGNTGAYQSGYSAAVTSNGYVFYSIFSYTGGPYYIDPVNHLQNGKDFFKAAPYLFYSPNSWSGCLYYDTINERFLQIGWFDSFSKELVDNTNDPFPWNQKAVGRTLVYGENTFNTDGGSTNGNSFAIMKDKNGNDYYIYKFYANSASVKRDAYTVASSIAVDFSKADFYAFSGKRTVVYYAAGSKLYAYDYNKGNEKNYLLKDFGSDQITMLKADTQMNAGDNPLYIATYNPQNGGTLQKYTQIINPDYADIQADEKCCWNNLIKINNISWRASN